MAGGGVGGAASGGGEITNGFGVMHVASGFGDIRAISMAISAPGFPPNASTGRVEGLGN